MSIVGQCRLCLSEAELQDSHFIPQAAYKLVRGKGRNPHPLVLEVDKVLQTSAQIRVHLLCSECEQRLHKNGEDIFFRYCYRGPGKFKLLEAIREQNPVLDDQQCSAYAVPGHLNSVLEQVGYMGLSILWKSAAHTWKERGGGTLPSVSLGSPYQEQIRRFLLSTGPFPEHGALVVELSNVTNRLIAVVGTPASSKWPTHHVHWIDLLGLTFHLFLGSRMPSQMKELSIFRPGQKCVLVAKNQEAMMARTYRKHLESLAERK